MTNDIEETAFPVAAEDIPANFQGMSLRDWFAGMAMQGMLASEPPNVGQPFDKVAYWAYQQANEMMEARKTF
jgi:hypothetical protein